MIRVALALTCLLCSSVGLTGGAEPPQPRMTVSARPPTALAAQSPVKPGQTWILSGTRADGQKVSRAIVLTMQAPSWSDSEGWSFDSEMGFFDYHPQTGKVFVGEMLSAFLTGNDVLMCFGFRTPAGITGALMSGSLEELQAESDKVDPTAPDPTTTEEALRIMRAAGMKVGTCTLTLKK
ncbi:hypothetical protein [Deinococcus arcticus]|uniref:Uncharacterized protein n=1 Tax=Deinococcus arcticus TaxID=2136176 RepID=A0A2T3W610_9DEIO|nr:hypothetical protein [Deinococcus arcticus]PTA67193.1 hypothetical protein C8263_13940 [Deinococcus arcticus]